MKTLTSLLVFIGFLGIAVPASAQYRITSPTGNEEGGAGGICQDPNVFICDNFEDRPLGTNPPGGYPNDSTFYAAGYKTTGWYVSTGNYEVITGAQCLGGTGKCLRARVPNGVASGGTFEQYWAGNPIRKVIGPTNYREIYWRAYERFDNNYVWSNIGTKNWEWFSHAGGGETGVFNTTANYDIHTPLFTLITGAGTHAPFDTIWHLTQNQNGTLNFGLNQWYCLEMHLRYNTGSTSTDAIMEGWIQRVGIDANPVQHWSYNTFVVDDRPNNTVEGIWFPVYINCNQTNDPNSQICVEQNGIRDKYIDNIIVSTARIGCGNVIAPPPLTPNPPTNPRLISWLLLGLPIAGLIALMVKR